MRSTSEVVELFTFLLGQGAVHIKVGDTVEAIFPPPATVADEDDDGNPWGDVAVEPTLKNYFDTPAPLRVR